MQIALLPALITREMDKTIRRCVWGSNEGQWKIHLVNWETLCKSKEDGGIGLRRSEDMNNAILARLGWRLLNNMDALWGRTLLGKYGRRRGGIKMFEPKLGSSDI